MKGAEAAAGVGVAAAGAGAVAKAAGGKLGAVSKLVSEISKPMKSGTMETAESAAKRAGEASASAKSPASKNAENNSEFQLDHEKILESAKRLDPADKGKNLTKSGRNYKKHSNHETSSIPKPKGSAQQISETAHQHIENLLNDANKRIVPKLKEKGRFGPHYEIHSSQPNTDGIIVSPDGDFIHFIDPE